MPLISGEGGGGGGTVFGQHVGLTAANIDISAAANYAVKWNAAFDDTYNYNALGSLPAGLGLAIPIDGSSAVITAIVAGVWSFLYYTRLAADATAAVALYTDDSITKINKRAAVADELYLCQVLALPLGATERLVLSTGTAATASPYNATALTAFITRLA